MGLRWVKKTLLWSKLYLHGCNRNGIKMDRGIVVFLCVVFLSIFIREVHEVSKSYLGYFQKCKQSPDFSEDTDGQSARGRPAAAEGDESKPFDHVEHTGVRAPLQRRGVRGAVRQTVLEKKETEEKNEISQRIYGRSSKTTERNVHCRNDGYGPVSAQAI